MGEPSSVRHRATLRFGTDHEVGNDVDYVQQPDIDVFQQQPHLAEFKVLGSRIEAPTKSSDTFAGLHEPLTRAEFEAFSEPLLAELRACTAGLLERCGAAGEIDAVFLTGGSSQIPAVRRLFTERFGEERVRTRDAFTSVAEGLGRAAASL